NLYEDDGTRLHFTCRQARGWMLFLSEIAYPGGVKIAYERRLTDDALTGIVATSPSGKKMWEKALTYEGVGRLAKLIKVVTSNYLARAAIVRTYVLSYERGFLKTLNIDGKNVNFGWDSQGRMTQIQS